MNDLSGHTLGRYHLIEKLGEGGMAVVYKAFDTRLERDVALKIIRTDQFAPAVLDRILKRFEREAKAMARLSHPNIVKVLDYGDHEGSPYLVMEYLPGGTLKQRLGKPMPYLDAATLLGPIAEAIEFAHSEKILHRDIKPSNILITKSGRLMLTDFGIAKLLDSEEGQTLTGTGVGVGTPEYMSPEQGLGREVDIRSDVYSLGVIFYELVTGRKPYQADTPIAVVLKQVNDPLPRPGELVKDIPEKVEQILFKALAKEPADRYLSMQEFENALDQLKTGTEKSIASEQDSHLPEANTYDTATMDTLGTRLEISPAKKEREPVIDNSSIPANWSLMEGNHLEITLDEDENVKMEFIRIPAGEFLMGSDPIIDPLARKNEQPQHRIFLDEYWIAKYPVTRQQWQVFAKQNRNILFQWFNQTNSIENIEGHPVTGVTYMVAIEFCDWVSNISKQNVTLPTEAQWEKAARGIDGNIFPWSNSLNKEETSKFQPSESVIMLDNSLPNNASPFGIMGMTGGVWEWVPDWYDESFYEKSPYNNPTGPNSGSFRVLRGGSWRFDEDFIRSTNRDFYDPTLSGDLIGFRCAVEINP